MNTLSYTNNIVIIQMANFRQSMSTWLHVFARLRGQSELRLHEFRHIRLGFALCFPSDDPGLLGELISAGTEIGRTVAHAVLHRYNFPGVVLSRQSYSRYRSDVLRRVAEESGRGGSRRRGSHSGTTVFFYFFRYLTTLKCIQ